MNVVLYVNNFLPVYGGREFVVHHLAIALMQLGHKVRVLGPGGFWTYRNQDLPYPVHRWPTFRGRPYEQLRIIQLALDTTLWGCDVIHAHVTYPNGYTAVRLKQIRKFPLVITPHGGDIQTIPELGHGLRLDAVVNKKITFAVRGAEVVTAISRDIESVLTEIRADDDRVRLIPNGVDLDRFDRPPSPNIRRWLGVEPDARLLVTIGSYRPLKGHDFLIRAMPKILATERLARLVIVGVNTEALLPLIKDLNLEGKVVLTGGIWPPQSVFMAGTQETKTERESDHLAELLASSELYVSAGSHRNAEGLSLAILEAMASSLPIVGTAISGNTDVVFHGQNGLLTEPANADGLAEAVLQILEQKEIQTSMRRKALETVSRYGWSNVAQQYVDVYEEAIAASR